MLASGRPIPGLKQLAEKLEIGEDLILAGMNGSMLGLRGEELLPQRDHHDQASGEHVVDDLLRGLGVDLPAGEDLILAGMNGSIIVDKASGEVIARREIDAQTAQAISSFSASCFRPGIGRPEASMI
jgi:hydroxymethylpyrimidine pyrophosphatase-like HAD family hydrolase